jgi:hypothetical protein
MQQTWLHDRRGTAGCFSVPVCVGQIQIESHEGVEAPQDKVTVLFDMTSRVASEEFHLRDASTVIVVVTGI